MAFAASGFLVLGPLSYTILSSASTLFPGTSTAIILQRIFAIQLVEPIRIGTFLPTTSLMAGASWEHALEKAQADTMPTVVRSWCVFTPFLFVAMRYLPLENRVPLLASVGAVWNTYMSFVAHRETRRGTV